MHISLNQHLTLTEAHEIGKNVQRTIKNIEGIHKVFVHIDPIGMTSTI
ncbi:MAG TPA: cation transporter dimerization domain-containing protein [Candidatus Wujingus californicus]